MLDLRTCAYILKKNQMNLTVFNIYTEVREPMPIHIFVKSSLESSTKNKVYLLVHHQIYPSKIVQHIANIHGSNALSGLHKCIDHWQTYP